MRNLFPGHYRPTDDAQRRLWKEALIALDTNVLLDVYRVSAPTASELLRTLERLKERLWLPYQVAREYHNRLEGVIADQTKPYDEAMKHVEELIASLKNPRRHPFIEDGLLSELEQLGLRVKRDLTTHREAISHLLGDNPVKERIASLIGEKVGPPPTPEQMAELCTDGKQRFDAGVPPGYADMKDKPEPQRYGDFILWKQLLTQMKEAKKSAILITGEVKEDWFLRIAGKTLGPRPELIAEAKQVTGRDIYIYQTPAFLHMVATQLGEVVKKEAIEEVQDLERQRVEFVHGRRETMHRARRFIEEMIPGARVVRMLPRRPGRSALFVLEDGRRVEIDLEDPSVYSVREPVPTHNQPASDAELLKRHRQILLRLSEEASASESLSSEQDSDRARERRRLLEILAEEARRESPGDKPEDV